MEKRVDFRKISVKNIEGVEEFVDFSKLIGNKLYMQGRNIEECELGSKLWHEGEVEIDEKKAQIISTFIQDFPYIAVKGIKDAMQPEQKD